jgi:hypothetical protein
MSLRDYGRDETAKMAARPTLVEEVKTLRQDIATQKARLTELQDEVRALTELLAQEVGIHLPPKAMPYSDKEG